MRTIKFRVWDKHKKYMHKLDALFLDEKMFRVQNYKNEHDVFSFGTEYFSEPMQFTGLLDKNGVEIYEGDVVKKHISNFTSELDEVGVVEFHLASFFFFEKNIKKPFLLQHPLDTQCSYMGNQIEIQYEVIGNIYEPKEQ